MSSKEKKKMKMRNSKSKKVNQKQNRNEVIRVFTIKTLRLSSEFINLIIIIFISVTKRH